ncbi:MAG: hypothetical protein V1652_03775 [bacterium]
MLQSISKEFGISNLLEILSTAPMRRLQPILVHAFKNRAKVKKPTKLLQEYEKKQEFLGISSIAQDNLYKFALICHGVTQSTFEAVQTSPIAPFGLNAVLSMVSQNNTLSSIRGSEVVSDLTSQLALECALRRKRNIARKDDRTVHISTSGRVLRLQPFDKSRGYMQHFNLFALCSGGPNTLANGGFAVPILRTHIAMLLNVISALHKEGYESSNITVKISDMRFIDQLITTAKLPREDILRNSLNDDFNLFTEYEIQFPTEVEHANDLSSTMFSNNGLPDRMRYFAHIERGIVDPLRMTYPGVRFCFNFDRKAGLGYYPHLCLHIFATNQKGNKVQVADGGAVNWATKLLGNKREAMVTSGIGAELMQKLFQSSNSKG